MSFVSWMFTVKPEFVTVLADRRVNAGDDVTLSCKVNTKDVKATWLKNGSRPDCVQGKHSISKTGKLCSLEIERASGEDEGNYTLEVTNSLGSASCSAMVTVVLKNWRGMTRTAQEMENSLRNYTVHKDVNELRFLLHGPVGSGKSTIINTIKSIFERRLFLNCLVGEAGKSFTLDYQKFTVGSESSGHLPFVFYDVMGLEEGQTKGARTDDIISALKGHVPEGYRFKETHGIDGENKNYINKPDLNNKIHCLVSVLPADKITVMGKAVIDKMRTVGKAAKDLHIPQFIFMTRVDKECAMTNEDLRKVYQSKKIKDKVQECSNILGVPLNCIFPVKNYSKETELDEEINRLTLAALSQIVHSANDYVEECCSNQKPIQ